MRLAGAFFAFAALAVLGLPERPQGLRAFVFFGITWSPWREIAPSHAFHIFI
jgi:hypothetical protein